MPLAELLPQTAGSYVALMIIGFVVGAVGHLSRSRWLVLAGIILIFCAALALPLALNAFSDKPEAPGPLQPP